MQNSNVAIPASNADAVLLDSVSHWRQLGYFSRCSLWEINSSDSTIYGYASRNWLYPSRFSTQRVMHNVENNFLMFWIIRILLHYFLKKCHFFDPFTNNRETSFTLSRTLRTIDSLRAITITKLRLWPQQCVYLACMLLFHKFPWFDLGHQPVKKHFKPF